MDRTFDRSDGSDLLNMQAHSRLQWVPGDIAGRARRLLKGWTAEDVRAAAEGIDAILWTDLWETPPSRGRGLGSLTVLKQHYDEYSFDDIEVPAAQAYHYFAVFALCELDEANDVFSGFYNWGARFPVASVPPEKDWPSEAERMLIVSLMTAVDAIAFAEGLKDSQTLAADVGRKREKRSLHAKKAAARRHAPSAKVQELAIKLYTEGQWQSRRAAVHKLLPSLKKQAEAVGFRFSPDRFPLTVYEWLSQHDKDSR